MKTDIYSNPVFEEKDIFNLIYTKDLSFLDKIIVSSEKEIELLEQHAGIKFSKETDIDYTISVEEFDNQLQNNWFIPEEYKDFDIEEFCLALCKTDVERERVQSELTAYKEKNLMILLKTLKYIIDTLRKENVVWGVGRGSAVSSYVLYLLGVHKINSLRYDLNWKEFLR